MSLVAYAVAESDSGAIDGTGLDGAPLIGIQQGRVALVVSRQPPEGMQPTPETLWRYEEIVERLMARQPILPARFGTVLTGEDDARDALRNRQDELHQGLERVRGAVELGIRGSWTQEPAKSTVRSGTEYMLGQLDLRRRAERAARVVDPVRALARSSKVKVLPRASIPFLAAYLVDRDRTDQFVELVNELDATFDDGDLACTGPWPPYSFAQATPLDREIKGAAE